MSKIEKLKKFIVEKKLRSFSRAGDFLVGLTPFMVEILKSPRGILLIALWVIRNFCNKSFKSRFFRNIKMLRYIIKNDNYGNSG